MDRKIRMGRSIHRLPDIIIIGAMKAGTTSVFQYLVSHPAVVRGKRKEPSFFTRRNFQKGVTWYESLFPENDKLKCEASTNYTKYPMYGPVAQCMYATIPEAKLIYLVRHPVDRTISQIHHMAISAKRETGLISIENVERVSKSSIDISKYYYQVSHFLQYYDPLQILYVRFEDLIANPLHSMQQVAQFLGIDGAFYTEDYNFRRHNVTSTSASVKYKTLHKYLFVAHLRKLIPPVHKLLETPVPRPQLTLEAKQFIWNAVEEDLRQFEALIGRSLDYSPPA